MYSCGPTVYNFAHIGNLRAYLFGDLLYRYLAYFKNFEVKWVMNITDIDDKTIEASRGPGNPNENIIKFTRKYEEEFFKDLKKLNIALVFHKNPRALEHIKEMQDLILKILKKGIAYIQDGSVYFSIEKYKKKYGLLVHIDFEGFLEGARIDRDEYAKESVKDFVLWKKKKEGEPSFVFLIDGVNYEGRPGWHIECSVMSAKYLGQVFDIHTGGVDLKFPHHENEIAQSNAGYGKNPAQFWCHNEHLMVNGQKMAKSLGNFYTLHDLESKKIDPRHFRFFIFSNHYRKKCNFTFEALEGAKNGLSRIEELISKLSSITQKKGKSLKKILKTTEKKFTDALDNDLNTPKALAALFDLIKKVNTSIDKEQLCQKDAKEALQFLKKINQLFAVFQFTKKSIDTNIEKLITLRNKARKEKNYNEADRIRNELKKAGIVLEDTPDGTVWKKV